MAHKKNYENHLGSFQEDECLVSRRLLDIYTPKFHITNRCVSYIGDENGTDLLKKHIRIYDIKKHSQLTQGSYGQEKSRKLHQGQEKSG